MSASRVALRSLLCGAARAPPALPPLTAALSAVRAVRRAASSSSAPAAAASSAARAAAPAAPEPPAPPLPLSPLTAVCALDGRYAAGTAALRPFFSEFALIKYRVLVEAAWLEALCDAPGVPEARALSPAARAALRGVAAGFDAAGAARVKAIEATTNHDVKAVEYFLVDAFAALGGAPGAELSALAPFVHFGLTSEDVNNAAYALMVRDATAAALLPAQRALVGAAVGLAEAHAELPMLARTHGQPATPTTVGREWAVFAARLARAAAGVAAVRPAAKLNGATGGFNALAVAYPRVDWPALARGFVESRLGLAYTAYSTQIEPHDWVAAWAHALARFNTVLLDLDRDAWAYVSMGHFRQRAAPGEVGSSTMPHKVNPIDFENSEGNAGLANALLEHLAAKLPVSRLQRDLSDSTALRALGPAAAHSLLAATAAARGLGKLDVDAAAVRAELDARWEVLAEPVQTLLRKHGARDAYERLKALTRGRGAFTSEGMRAFVRALGDEGALPPAAVAQLLELTPATYVGVSAALARGVRAHVARELGEDA